MELHWDTFNRLFDSYLSLKEADEQQVRGFRTILHGLAELDRFARQSLEHGHGGGNDASHARYLRLDIAIRMHQEIADSPMFELFDLQFAPIHRRLVDQDAIAVIDVQRPTLSLGDLPQELAPALPAIMRARPVKVDDDLTRLKKLRYNASTIEMAAASALFSQGQHPIMRMWESADRLVAAAIEIAPSLDDRVALLEQHLLFNSLQQRYFVRRKENGSGRADDLAWAQYKLLDAALNLSFMREKESQSSDLSLVEVLKQTQDNEQLDVKIVGAYPNFVRLREMPTDPAADMPHSLMVAQCNAAARTFEGVLQRHNLGADSISGTVLATERLLQAALNVEVDPVKRKQIIDEAAKFAQQLEKRAQLMLEAGVGRYQDLAFAKYLRLDLEIRSLAINLTDH